MQKKPLSLGGFDDSTVKFVRVPLAYFIWDHTPNENVPPPKLASKMKMGFRCIFIIHQIPGIPRLMGKKGEIAIKTRW